MITTTHIIEDKASFLEAVSLINTIQKSSFEPSEVLFFDIETTGLSPASSYLYLIGCMFMDNKQVLHRQFFSEGIDEEALLINAYDELLSSHKILVHFNGQTFDIPYVEKKRIQLELNNPNPDIISFDIFRELKPLKKAFRLTSMSQKSLEVFAGLNRKDMYDGGQLIEVYNRYIAFKRLEAIRSNRSGIDFTSFPSLGTPSGSSSELLEVLLLHNYEDVLGMLKVAELLSIVTLFKGAYRVLETQVIGDSFVVTIVPDDTAAAAAFTCPKEYVMPCEGTLHIAAGSNGVIKLELPLYTGELKLFYANYKDYYYLPAEDSAVHKSIGEFLDKSIKTKCTRANCYTRFSGTFLPWPSKITADCTEVSILRKTATDHFGFVNVDEITDGSHLSTYINELFGSLF